MNITGASLKHPYAVIALALAFVALGSFAFFRTPTDLFPDTSPPQVVVVTVEPGAVARDVADKITQVVEKELNTITGLKRVVSTSRDEVSSVNAEFLYKKPIGEAVTDVQNALSRIRAELPGDILEPRIYRITDATRPLLTLSLRPKAESSKSLSEIRLLAENEIEDQILTLPGVADVDVFGGHQPEVEVHLDRDRLAANGVSLGQVVAALTRQNVSAPAGTIYEGAGETIVRVAAQFQSVPEIREFPVIRTEGGFIRISDLGEVKLGEQEQRSAYHGNGKPAIAINVMRPDGGPTVAAIKSVKEFLPTLAARYSDISFEITDDQQPIIDLNVSGMRTSLTQAVLLTVLVIFLFLANLRTALVVSVSIPLAFLASLVVLWFSPYTLNMVTLSGLIIAVGMVVDASVVVLENIYRHYLEMEDPDPVRAAQEGTSEVSLAITAGMLTTVIVLFPVMFAGGYTQQTMRPLNMMISATLVASLMIALTVVPLMASKLLSKRRRRKNFLERILGVTDLGVRGLTAIYTRILRGALKVRWLTLLLAAAFLVTTMKTVPPLLGAELMPPMDTGISIVEFDTPASDSPATTEAVLTQVEEMIYRQSGVEMVSSVQGSEAGEVSFGGGGATSQSARIVVHLVDRKHREATIWEINDGWREELRAMPGIKSFRVSEYGATPLSTTKAPFDLIISGPDPVMLDRVANQCLDALKGVRGLADVRRAWYLDKREQDVVVDPDLARLYGLTPAEAAAELKVAVKGVPATPMRLSGYLDIPIRVRYAASGIDRVEDLKDVYLTSRFGQVPLRAVGKLVPRVDQPFITRERLQATIDITGVNRGVTIKHVAGAAAKRLAKLKLPEGYSVKMSGTPENMKTGSQEMGGALRIGIVLLFLLLLAMFGSFRHPITIMAAIPLAVAGALWGLLLFDKPMCKPATMGMILLGGTIVNNSILLLDFILEARKRGVPKEEAILEAVRLRIRPILMTTVSTIVGLTPLVFELAVGLERMSPLGIVAATGLLAGTFLTIIVIPVVYSTLDSIAATISRVTRFFIAPASEV